MSGGNCWGNDANYPVDSEPEPAFELFDNILEKVCPNVTFLQYKKICNKVIKYDTRIQNEYYGNYYHYSIKKANYHELYHCLKEMKVI